MLIGGGGLVVWSAAASIGASASSTPAVGRDDNRGTYWLKDTNDCGTAAVGAVAPRPCASPSHEPHLGCDTIFLIGDGLVAANGVFDIEIISPSLRPPRFNDLTAYHATWVDTQPHHPQVIAKVSVATLIADAQAAERAIGRSLFLQPQQGYHFKLELTQLSPGEPAAFQPPGDQKFKTFWVNCAATAGTTTSTSTSSGTTTSTTSTVSTTGSVSSTGTSTTATGSVSALTTSRSTTTAITGAVSALTVSATSNTGSVKAVSVPNTGAGGTLGAGFGLLLVGGALVTGAEAAARRRNR